MGKRAKQSRATTKRAPAPAASPGNPAPALAVPSAPPARRLALLAAGAVITVIAMAGPAIWLWSNRSLPVALQAAPAVDRAAASAPVPAVTAAAPGPGASRNAAAGFLGVVLSGESVAVEPKEEGRIVNLLVKTGDRVLRGTVLAQLDRLVREQDLLGARAAVADASRRFARRAALARGPDPAVTAEELDAARSQLAQDRARLATVSAALDETQVVAPFDGTVAELYLAPGALAGPGRPVARVVSQGQLQVRFAIPESGVAPLASGAAVEVEIASLALVARGTVTGVNPEVDSSSRMIHAAARLDVAGEVARRLTTGLLARVRPAAPGPLDVAGEQPQPLPALPPPWALPPVPPPPATPMPSAAALPAAASVAADESSGSSEPSLSPPRARARRTRGQATAMPRW